MIYPILYIKISLYYTINKDFLIGDFSLEKYVYKIYKVFILYDVIEGKFQKIETLDSNYFSLTNYHF